MAGRGARSPSTKRFHIVLIPGFAGFDALGQLEYYSGITPLFQTWLAGNQVLHYFDNFPTAAVVTRATRLRSYLARRIARGDISVRDDVIDDVTLVGHSTGGLDIRRLLWDLHHRRQPIVVDGGAKVEPAKSSSVCVELCSSPCPIGVPTSPTGCTPTASCAGRWSRSFAPLSPVHN